MRQAEEIAPLVTGYLYQGGRVVDPPLKTRPCFRIYADNLLLPEIPDRVLHLFGLVYYDHFPFKRRYRHPLKELLTDMMCLISHAMLLKQLILCVPNGRRTPAGKVLRRRS